MELADCSSPIGTAVAVDSNLTPELQYARCMSNRYRSEDFPQCVSCTRRWAGDTCRFQGIRYFLKDKAGVMRGISFVDNQKEDGPSHTFPNKWNVPLEERHILRTKVSWMIHSYVSPS
jgi:[histone H3]-dimethyl-L-lysine9 demethylase